jgi:predicted DNA-binding transcriptional regulator AlpA
MGRRLKAHVDERQLGLFGEDLGAGANASGHQASPSVAVKAGSKSAPPKAMTIAARQAGTEATRKPARQPVKRRSLGSLPAEVVRPPEAASLLSVSLSLLKKWRLQGGGPRFVRLGGRAIGYRRADLIDWIDGLAG